jgi:hypothetical protein
MTLTEKLKTLVARATAVTMGTDTATDASKLLQESNPLWTEIGEHAAEMLPVLDTIIPKLEAAMANAPAAVKAELAAYRRAAAEAKFDWIEPPGSIVGFLVLDALQRIRANCAAK